MNPAGARIRARAGGYAEGMDTSITDPAVTGGDDARSRQVSLDFGHDVDAARRAREAIQELFEGRADPLVDDVRLVTSELVTNVIQHTDDGGSLLVVDPRPDGPVRIEVADRDCRPPPFKPVRRALGGRGLSIVDGLCSRWGVRRMGARGKVVWAEFDAG